MKTNSQFVQYFDEVEGDIKLRIQHFKTDVLWRRRMQTCLEVILAILVGVVAVSAGKSQLLPIGLGTAALTIWCAMIFLDAQRDRLDISKQLIAQYKILGVSIQSLLWILKKQPPNEDTHTHLAMRAHHLEQLHAEIMTSDPGIKESPPVVELTKS